MKCFVIAVKRLSVGGEYPKMLECNEDAEYVALHSLDIRYMKRNLVFILYLHYFCNREKGTVWEYVLKAHGLTGLRKENQWSKVK